MNIYVTPYSILKRFLLETNFKEDKQTNTLYNHNIKVTKTNNIITISNLYDNHIYSYDENELTIQDAVNIYQDIVRNKLFIK